MFSFGVKILGGAKKNPAPPGATERQSAANFERPPCSGLDMSNMKHLKKENPNLETGRLVVRHYVFIVAAFSLLTAAWAWSLKPMAGVAAFCTFSGMLLPAWQLSSKSHVQSGRWGSLSREAKENLRYAFAGVLLTAVGYGVGLAAMFA